MVKKKITEDDSHVFSLIQEVFKRYSTGTLSYARLSRYEMVELGFDPSDPEDVIKYDKFMNDLSDNLEKMEEFLESFKEPVKNEVVLEADFNLEKDE